MSNDQGKTSMAAFLTADNLEPATRTLDFVRLVFHFCNFVNLTLGGIALGVGIGYNLSPTNVSASRAITPVQTKFIITGVFVIIHGLVGTYGFVSRQSRSLILYGLLGVCLLVVGAVVAWTARVNMDKMENTSMYEFYTSWNSYSVRMTEFLEEKNRKRIVHTDCQCQRDCEGEDDTCNDTIIPCWAATHSLTKNTDTLKDKNYTDDLFIWGQLCVTPNCHMRYIPDKLITDKTFDESVTILTEYLEQAYYICEDYTKCTDDSNCDLFCDTAQSTYDKDKCDEICTKQVTPHSCIKFTKLQTRARITTIAVTMYMLSVTQVICLFCSILFIFWNLKEETDIEIHTTDNTRCSLKLRLLSQFLPCCFHVPDNLNRDITTRHVPLSDIMSESGPTSPDSPLSVPIAVD